ncbi:MAG TPA: helix-turn-helix transcriptional regulator [Bacteroidales bacterium]|nr:helix-turn-helix transcriptional regulator [Bacteroidales bacterium]HRR49010.1 helix-turn-helix transcriptional regulator [Bacteroidales bacterium]HRT33147.1 helix-turn-helix transcriptional regulator [Bacteroidales bacterium]HRT83185.1 helix-turn-helix transcriptional regulator [Bacteroidales bacterium]
MKERLQQFLNAEQLSSSKLSDILGIQRSGMSHILSGRNKPSFDFIQKLLLKFPSLNAEWLITGKGNMYKENSDASLYANRAEYQSDEKENEDYKPPEILINESEKIEAQNNRRLIKIILIYSDGTFSDFRHERIKADNDN